LRAGSLRHLDLDQNWQMGLQTPSFVVVRGFLVKDK
jgi:hypothetical protein